MSIIPFNYATWIGLFPQFAYLNEQQAAMYFTMATNYVRNDGAGPITDDTLKTTLLNLVTAHLVQLFAPTVTGQSPSGIVGRISNASEGSVSVATDYEGQSSSRAWWVQTSFGAAAWQLMLPFRTMRYRPGPQRNFNPLPGWPFFPRL